jgi:hypothetical protein
VYIYGILFSLLDYPILVISPLEGGISNIHVWSSAFILYRVGKERCGIESEEAM